MSYSSLKNGFTLVEMMVVLSIFSVITGLVISNVPSLRNRVSVDLVSQNIAINIKSAQSFGTAIRQVNGQTPRSWGIHFNSHIEDKFILFYVFGQNDKRFDGLDFGCSDNTNCFEVYSIRGATVDEYCINFIDSTQCGNYSLMDVSFTRPSLEPEFCARNNYIDSCYGDNISSFSFRVSSSSDLNQERFLTIYSNGQISVDF